MTLDRLTSEVSEWKLVRANIMPDEDFKSDVLKFD